jgi:Right handed beta helix region
MKSLIKNDEFAATSFSHFKSQILKPAFKKNGWFTLIEPVMVLAAITISLACASTVGAQALRQRVFVSAESGVNAGACPLNSPCKTFAYAVNHVIAGGEVVALTSGGYGTVTITKALTLTAPAGVHASIIADTAGTNAVTVTAGTTETVVLRGLHLLGLGGDNGILVTQAGAVHVENCVISSFDGLGTNGMGIKHAASGKLFVKDSIVRDNNHTGIFVEAPVGTTAEVSIDNTRAENNYWFGIYLFARAKGSISRSVTSGGTNASGIVVNNGNSGDAANASTVAISDCAASHQGADGFAALGTGSRAVVRDSSATGCNVGFRADDGGELSVEHCVALNNNSGLFAEDAGSVMRVSNSAATNNNYGFHQITNALFESRGNNTVRGNTIADTFGVITLISGT